MIRALVLAALLVFLPGCEALRKFEEKIPPVQLCVTYKGKTFCATKDKATGVWKFEADLSPEEREEVIRHIEGK